MSDPERLLHGSAGALSARLLRAGHDEGPSRRSVERTLAAVGVATTTLGAAGTAGALGSTAGAASTAGTLGAGAAGTLGALGSAGKAATTLTLLGLAKWAGVGVAGGVVVSLAAHGLETRTAAPRAATNVVVTAPGVASTPLAPLKMTEMAAAPSDNTELAGPSTSPADAKAAKRSLAPGLVTAPLASGEDATSAPLAAEVTFVDRARGLFQRGDARATLAALAGYEREFPERRLLPEVLLLRMEASSAAGDGARARAFAEAIVRDYGKGPHAARARAVLGEPSVGER